MPTPEEIKRKVQEAAEQAKQAAQQASGAGAPTAGTPPAGGAPPAGGMSPEQFERMMEMERQRAAAAQAPRQQYQPSPSGPPMPHSAKSIGIVLVVVAILVMVAATAAPGESGAAGIALSDITDRIGESLSGIGAKFQESLGFGFGQDSFSAFGGESGTTVGTGRTGTIRTGEGVSIKPLGSAMAIGGAQIGSAFPPVRGGKSVKLRVAAENRGLRAKDLFILLENCGDVEKIVFTAATDPEKVPEDADPIKVFGRTSPPASVQENVEQLGLGGAQCYFVPNEWEYDADERMDKVGTNLSVDIESTFYLGTMTEGTAADNPSKDKSFAGNVRLGYTLGESYELLRYDVEKGKIETTEEEAQASKQGGPIGYKIIAYNPEIKSYQENLLEFKLSLVGTDKGAESENMTISPNKLHIYVPIDLYMSGPKATDTGGCKAGIGGKFYCPDATRISEDDDIECRVTKRETVIEGKVARLEDYYQCSLAAWTALEKKGKPKTISITLKPGPDFSEENRYPLIVEMDEGGYFHVITEDKMLVYVTAEAG